MNNFFTKISNSFANRLYLWTFSFVALTHLLQLFYLFAAKKQKSGCQEF